MGSGHSVWGPLWERVQSSAADGLSGVKAGSGVAWSKLVDKTGGGFAHEVARVGDPKAMDMLMAAGFPTRTHDKEGRTPLMWAVRGGKSEVALQLLATAYGLAAYGKEKFLSNDQLWVGGGISAEDKYGMDAFALAVQRCDLVMAQRLLDFGSKVDFQSKRDGQSALMRACRTGRVGEAHWLMAAGADIALLDSEGQSALSHAACAGSAAMVDALLHAGASWRQADRHGLSPLALAVRMNRIDCVAALCARGADPRWAPSASVSGWDWAAKEGRFECTQAMSGAGARSRMGQRLQASRDALASYGQAGSGVSKAPNRFR